jgi:peroxiredoxin
MYAAVTLVPPAGSLDPAVLAFTSECYDLEKSSSRSASRNHSKKQKISPLSLSIISGTQCLQIQPGKLATIVCKTSVPSFSKATHNKSSITVYFF